MTKEESVERGWFSFNSNIFAMQNPGAYDAVAELINTIPIDIAVEIGTHHGGFTCMLADARNKAGKNMKIYSFDISDNNISETAKLYNFDFRKIDLLSDSSLLNEIFNIEGKDKKIAIFCDGGNKKHEFNFFSKYLKSGDIIGAHDYAKDPETFNNKIKGKVWNWAEITEADVIESINTYGLVDLPNDLTQKFENVAWLLKVKQ
jgi:cephalosporin hydroxylase